MLTDFVERCYYRIRRCCCCFSSSCYHRYCWRCRRLPVYEPSSNPDSYYRSSQQQISRASSRNSIERFPSTEFLPSPNTRRSVSFRDEQILDEQIYLEEDLEIGGGESLKKEDTQASNNKNNSSSSPSETSPEGMMSNSHSHKELARPLTTVELQGINVLIDLLQNMMENRNNQSGNPQDAELAQDIRKELSHAFLIPDDIIGGSGGGGGVSTEAENSKKAQERTSLTAIVTEGDLEAPPLSFTTTATAASQSVKEGTVLSL